MSILTITAPRGWVPADDLCWLDCERDGYRKTWHHSEIVLCPQHAQALEAGRYGQSYTGAPLPADTQATAWPWQRMAEQLVSVV